jgi:protein involved in polysaccharide export with SLBB domain
VWGYPEFTTRAVVNRFGTINVPLLGELSVAGYGREEFNQYLRHRLAELIKGEIKLAIEIVKPVPWILVIGAVPRQGSFAANRDIPLLEVLANVGGWNEQSDLRHIKISRQTTGGSDGGTFEVNLEWHLESGNIRSLPVLHPGDVVYVPKKENAVRETAQYLYDAFLLFGFFRLFD